VSLVVGDAKYDVTGPVFLGVCRSRHPQNHPGVEQWFGAGEDLDEVTGDVGSRQWPNQSRW
jgi:hypothetical protein